MRMSQKISSVGTLEKIVITGGVLMGAAAIVGAGAFAVFTSTGTATVNAQAGQLDVSISDTNLSIENMAPGDTVYKELTVDLAGTNLFSALDFSVTGAGEVAGEDPHGVDDSASLLSGTNGLTYRIVTCSSAWEASGSDPAVPFICPVGATSTVTKTVTALSTIDSTDGPSAKNSFVKTDFSATGDVFDTTLGDSTIHAMIILNLPVAANNGYQGAKVNLSFNVVATARGAVAS